jgi:hypothetical protein
LTYLARIATKGAVNQQAIHSGHPFSHVNNGVTTNSIILAMHKCPDTAKNATIAGHVANQSEL